MNTNITFKPSTVKVGERLDITCESSGLPEPKYIITNSTNDTVSEAKTFIIPKVNMGDAGIYTCIATNILGSDSASGNLTVKGKI